MENLCTTIYYTSVVDRKHFGFHATISAFDSFRLKWSSHFSFGVAVLLSFFPPFPDQLSPIDFFLPFDKMGPTLGLPGCHQPTFSLAIFGMSFACDPGGSGFVLRSLEAFLF